jgi:hypothetical protein
MLPLMMMMMLLLMKLSCFVFLAWSVVKMLAVTVMVTRMLLVLVLMVMAAAGLLFAFLDYIEPGMMIRQWSPRLPPLVLRTTSVDSLPSSWSPWLLLLFCRAIWMERRV